MLRAITLFAVLATAFPPMAHPGKLRSLMDKARSKTRPLSTEVSTSVVSTSVVSTSAVSASQVSASQVSASEDFTPEIPYPEIPDSAIVDGVPTVKINILQRPTLEISTLSTSAVSNSSVVSTTAVVTTASVDATPSAAPDPSPVSYVPVIYYVPVGANISGIQNTSLVSEALAADALKRVISPGAPAPGSGALVPVVPVPAPAADPAPPPATPTPSPEWISIHAGAGKNKTKELFHSPLSPQQYRERNFMWLRCTTKYSFSFDVGGMWFGENAKDFKKALTDAPSCHVINWKADYVNGEGWGDMVIKFDFFLPGCNQPLAVYKALTLGKKVGAEVGREMYLYNCPGFNYHPWSFQEWRNGQQPGTKDKGKG